MAVVHGDNSIMVDVADAIYDLMVSLKTAMDTAVDSPRFAAVYSQHTIVKMTLPAVSVDTESVSTRSELSGRSAGVGGVITETYDIRVSLRVHTSFKNRTADNLTVTRLLNSANNWVETHQRLNITGFNKLTVEKIDFDKEFSESLTVGGQITYLVVVALTHTQA